jgi:thiol-disulfide isomerase/thioredoxin
MNNKILIAVAALALVAGVVVSQWLRQPSTAPAPAPTITGAMPERMVEFSLPDTEGKLRSINDWKGKTIILNFWATWCPPCREEIPLLVEVHEKFKSHGLVVVSVAIDKKDDIVNFIDSYFINYPVLVNDQENTQLMAQYGNRVATLPYSVIIAPDGRIIGNKKGAYKRPELYSILEKMFGKV